tara:strand:+ start:9012 stop:9233 length:222 start_codon:yes stop_codon:yes gene_type:complete
MTNINIFQIKNELNKNKKIIDTIKSFLDDKVDDIIDKITDLETNAEPLTNLENDLYNFLIHFKDDLQNILINN